MKCKNPDCNKEIPKGLNSDYCSEDCLRRHTTIKAENKHKSFDADHFNENLALENSDIGADLKFFDITPQTTSKHIAYVHVYRLLSIIKSHNGQDWNKVRNLCRALILIDFRYIDDYLEAYSELGLIALRNDKIYYLGVPKTEPQP